MFGLQRDLLVGFTMPSDDQRRIAMTPLLVASPSLLVAFGGLMAAVDAALGRHLRADLPELGGRLPRAALGPRSPTTSARTSTRSTSCASSPRRPPRCS